MPRIFAYFIVIFLFLLNENEPDSYISGGYYQNIYRADSLFLVGQYQKANNILENTFDNFKPINLPYYEEYKSYVKTNYLIGKKTKAINSLESLISEYGITWLKINRDPILKEIVKTNDYPKAQYNILRVHYENTTLPDLKKEIEEMYMNDKKIREKYMGTNNLNKIDSVDKWNTSRLVEIFENHGYPSPKKLGLSNSNSNFDRKVATLLLHTKSTIRNKFFLPKIKGSVENGSCDPLIYGFLVDQLLVYEGKSQKYGTYNTHQELIIDSINKSRKTIGLPNYGYESWRREQQY